jgi:hypothetical protein
MAGPHHSEDHKDAGKKKAEKFRPLPGLQGGTAAHRIITSCSAYAPPAFPYSGFLSPHRESPAAISQ